VSQSAGKWLRKSSSEIFLPQGLAFANFSPRRIFLLGLKIGEYNMTLKEVKTGQTVTVEKLLGDGAVKRRIMDMGITKGTEIYVRKVAPLGDPVEVTVRGYELSIRKADAELIQLK
jgi:ferrous iron transport protein A